MSMTPNYLQLSNRERRYFIITAFEDFKYVFVIIVSVEKKLKIGIVDKKNIVREKNCLNFMRKSLRTP